jgi:alkanesulfonate monooxygenase SsuD/methylene tetrahydromethanopterin reductase-like flavin-dependent oxidoreductase (luciferase family)
MTATMTTIHPWVAEGTERVRFGLEIAPQPDFAATRDFVQMAEGLGFDSLWIPDHPMVLGNATWTTLAALATATSAIRLGTLVACAAYGNPVILARAAADVDRLSNGRMVLGLGSGDMPHEFAQLGIAWEPVAARQARLEETLRIVQPLLRGETVSFSGDYVQAEGAVLDPPPVQQPYLPVLIAGGGERTTLRFVAEYADSCNLGAVDWAGGAYTTGDIARKLDVLDQHCARVEREPESVLRTGLALVSLGETEANARAKLAWLPPHMVSFFGQLPLAGTPEMAIARLQPMLSTGFRYLIFIVFDPETAQLLAHRVLPALTAG